MKIIKELQGLAVPVDRLKGQL